MSNKTPIRANYDSSKNTSNGAYLKNKGFISCVKDALHVNKSIFYRFICPAMSFIFLLLGLFAAFVFPMLGLFPGQAILGFIVFVIVEYIIILLALTLFLIRLRYLVEIGVIAP